MPLVSEQSPIAFIFNCILDLLNVNQDNDILKFEINKTAKSKSLNPYFRRKRMSNIQVNSSAMETQALSGWFGK